MIKGCDQLAWSAGIMDGEGCTMIANVRDPRSINPTTKHKLRLQVGQSSNGGIPQMLSRMQDLYGGYIHNIKARGNQKPVYIWTLHGHQRVQYAIACMWKWLTPEKQEQAKKAFVIFNAEKHGHKVPHPGQSQALKDYWARKKGRA